MSWLPNLPLTKSLKKSVITFVFSFSPLFLMIVRNSLNSIIPEPSSSTKSIIFYTSFTFYANPSPINGSCISWSPIEPSPPWSRELKQSLSLRSSLRLVSMLILLTHFRSLNNAVCQFYKATFAFDCRPHVPRWSSAHACDPFFRQASYHTTILQVLKPNQRNSGLLYC